MVRGILFHIIPLLVPFIVYAIYLYYLKKAGGEKTWQGKSVAVLTLIGLFFMAISFIVLWVFQERSADGVYIPQHMENGKLIDSQVIPRKQN
ncbi:hypothetical protein A9Q83_09965 [Alphaproteobacteria bacterium 46_93_T64]|nr:hypothetical protein A9Q83_09965 [Alphaproteobacteria bacterium 46_93_T64]